MGVVYRVDNEWKSTGRAWRWKSLQCYNFLMISVQRRFTREGEVAGTLPEAEQAWFTLVRGANAISTYLSSERESAAFFDELAYALRSRMAWVHSYETGPSITVDAAMAQALGNDQRPSTWEEHARAAWREPEYTVRFEETLAQWAARPGQARNTQMIALNIGAFFDQHTYVFDVDSFRHVVRLLVIASDALVGFESKDESRSLFIAPTNVAGGVLMSGAIPYDSRDARAVSAAVCAIATGEAMVTSAELAKFFGSCGACALQRNECLRVVRNQRRAAYGSSEDQYEKVTVPPQRIDASVCPVYLLKAARMVWDRALELGEIYGFRNAQVTCIDSHSDAVHEEIGATSGCEPVSEPVLFRKRSDGTYERTVHPAALAACTTLGIAGSMRDDVVRYVCGVNTLAAAPHINHTTLQERGLCNEDIALIERELPHVFDVQYAFHVVTLGEAIVGRLGISHERARDVSCNVLLEIGFSDEQIVAASQYVCGAKTFSGAPHIKPEHTTVFATAHQSGGSSGRVISSAAHVAMAAAVQPFITGIVRKTVHLPREATPEHIKETWQLAWRSALKEVAVYRDGCTMEAEVVPALPVPIFAPAVPAVITELPEVLPAMQTPYSSPQELEEARAQLTQAQTQLEQLRAQLTQHVQQAGAGLQFGMRRTLPSKRTGLTIEATVGNQQVYLRTGEYADGNLGEIFIDMYREGAAFRSVLNCFAIAVSIGLQHGVPLEKFVDKFTYTRFEPSGFTTHPNVKMCTSIVDYIFRVLAVEYLKRNDLAQVPRDESGGAVAGVTNTTLQVGEQTAFIPPSDTPLCERCGHTTVYASGHFKCNNCGAVNG